MSNDVTPGCLTQSKGSYLLSVSYISIDSVHILYTPKMDHHVGVFVLVSWRLKDGTHDEPDRKLT